MADTPAANFGVQPYLGWTEKFVSCSLTKRFGSATGDILYAVENSKLTLLFRALDDLVTSFNYITY